jgi:hypothetical protein
MADQEWSSHHQGSPVSVNQFSGEYGCIISSRYTLEFDSIPKTIGIMNGGIDFKLTNIGDIWNDRIVKTANDTIFVTYDIPEQQGYLPFSFKEQRNLVLQRTTGNFEVFDSILPSQNWKYENTLTDWRIAKVLKEFLFLVEEKHLAIQDFSDANIKSIFGAIYPNMINLFKAPCALTVDSTRLSFSRNPSRIWSALDSTGQSGQCQEATFLLDNFLRTLGFSSAANFKPISIFGRFDQCLGIKNYPLLDTGYVWIPSKNDNPKGYWTFSLGVGQEWYNSLYVEYKNMDKELMPGLMDETFTSLLTASNLPSFSNLHLTRVLLDSLGRPYSFGIVTDDQGEHVIHENVIQGGASCEF